jgi:hypothetical protein
VTIIYEIHFCCLEILRFPEIRTCETSEELRRVMRLGTLAHNLDTKWGKWSALCPIDILNIWVGPRPVLLAVQYTKTISPAMNRTTFPRL